MKTPKNQNLLPLQQLHNDIKICLYVLNEAGMEQLLAMLQAAGDPTRLRLFLLLREAELTVSELTQILGQSQPRVSRHLRLLCEAGLLQRFKEGSWVFYRAVDRGVRAQLSATLATLASAEPDLLEGRQAAPYPPFANSARRRRRPISRPTLRNGSASARFTRPNRKSKRRSCELFRWRPRSNSLLDAGTGTGRMLELLAPQIRRGVGLDVSPEMLAIARDRLERAGAQHCQVRLGRSLSACRFADGSNEQGFDAVLFHQVLHYLDDPQAAIVEAARVLKAGRAHHGRRFRAA